MQYWYLVLFVPLNASLEASKRSVGGQALPGWTGACEERSCGAGGAVQMSQRQVPLELEALLKAAKSIGLLNLTQASTMRNNVATGQLSAGVVTADLQKKVSAAKLKWEQEKADARLWAKGRWARAIFDFQPTSESGDARIPDLQFVKEDIIQLTMGAPMKWWRGTLASSPSRDEGEFPSNYVELLEKHVATCDHQGETSGELSIWAGDVIVVVRRGEDRCYGFTERRAGEIKPFPARCLRAATHPHTQHRTDAEPVARGTESTHVTVDVSDDDDLSDPRTSMPQAAALSRQRRLKIMRNATADSTETQEKSAAPKLSFQDVGATLIEKLRHEERAILAEMEAAEKLDKLKSTLNAAPVRHESRKWAKWVLMASLTLTVCLIDFSLHFVFDAVPDNDGGTIYRHKGIPDTHENGTFGWPRVKRNLQHAGHFWDPRTPCGETMSALMGSNESSTDEYVDGIVGVITCDGDSVLFNIGQSFGAGVVFAVAMSCTSSHVRSRLCCCTTHSEKSGHGTHCTVLIDILVVLLLGELVNFHHEFVASGRTSDPSTVDLWLVTFGLFAGLSLPYATLPICSCCIGYWCSCIETDRLRKHIVARERQNEHQKLEIEHLKAHAGSWKAGMEVLKHEVSKQPGPTEGLRQDDDERDLPFQSDDLSDAETDPGYHVFYDKTHPTSQVLRVRFDANQPIGVDVLDGGALGNILPRSSAAKAGVTLHHTITAINDTQIAPGADARSIIQLLSLRPVYVSFEQDAGRLETEPAHAQEPRRASEMAEF